MPIITHEDELELAKIEKDLAKKLNKVAKEQNNVISSQKKYADNIADLNIERQSLNRTFRDVLKQLQTLVREKRSNVKDEDVKLYQDIIHDNDIYIENNDKYLNAIKDIAARKEYLISKINDFADALEEVSKKRSAVIKKALNIEKAKNKMIDGDKLNALDQEFNDYQRDFDRARDILLK
ncbi:MAG: hypothetical protein GF383_02745, partial [Candidatus Lokiarchaeota archaeon]|nr:hypothetical protein [Candidatus Lokiarchaeota archaeon]MBD3338407.1 hypothetical protein [Candidatus Lokiarchaeota archaeon]